MSDKVIIVTSPDDILIDGLRILLVDLTPDQTQVISTALSQFETIPTIVTYVSSTDDINWCIDKKQKSSLIIFNADSENQTLAGYMAAQRNSHYFGNLKSLSIINNSALHTTEQIYNLLGNAVADYER